MSHETNQENIIKILSSHEYKSGTKKALWELNKILKSIHLLKYIDDIDYRRNIRAALNRGEAYHQLLKKIMEVGGGSFHGMSEIEVEIWNECARLIALFAESIANISVDNMVEVLSKILDNAVNNTLLAAV